jgi:multiple sugar transport system substrate-binding protein
MKSKITRALLFTFVYLILVSLAAFSTPQVEAEGETGQITMTFSTWTITEETFGHPIQVILGKFEESNPNVKIDVLGVPFAQYKDQLVIAATGGNPPDVIHGNSQTMISYYGLDLLEPLDNLAPAALINDIFPTNLEGVTFDGNIMAMPWAPHPNPLLYNKDLLQKAGLNPEKPPEKWADFDRMARQVAKIGTDADGNRIWGIAIANAKHSHSGVVFEAMVLAHGGSYFDAQGKPRFNSGPVKAAFKEMSDWAKDDVMPTGVWQVDIRGLFASQRVGFNSDFEGVKGIYRKNSGLGEEFDKILGAALMPKSPITNRSETVFTEHQLAVAKASEHKELAMDLVEHFVGKEMMIYYHGTNAVLSARKSIAKLPEMRNPFTNVYIEQLETATPLPARHPAYDNAMLLVTKALERVLTNNEDIDTVLAETQNQVLELYGM